MQFEERVCSVSRVTPAVRGEGVQYEESTDYCYQDNAKFSAFFDLTLLQLHTLSSNCTPSPRTAHPLLALHTLSSNCTPSPRTAHSLYRVCLEQVYD